MKNPELEEFAKILVQQVRDTAIQSSDANIRPDVMHIISKRWKEAGQGGNLESIASVLIPDIVDDAIYHLLQSIDQGLLQLTYKASTGKTIFAA